MATNNITLTKNLDYDNLAFSEVKKNSMGGNMVYMQYNNKKLMIQTPEMAAPFGLSTFTDDKSGAVKYSIDVSFRDVDTNPKIKDFYDKMVAFDECVLKSAVENSKAWFGKQMSMEVVKELYKNTVKPSNQPEKYAPTMKFKIRDIGKVAAYDEDQEAINPEMGITKGSKIRTILDASSVWFVNKQFGVSWNLIQIQVKKPQVVEGFAMQNEDSEDDEEYEEEEKEEHEEEQEHEEEVTPVKATPIPEPVTPDAPVKKGRKKAT